MIPSCGRAKTARLNWKHMFHDSSNDVPNETPYVQIVFVQPTEYEDYKAIWNGKIAIVQLPESLPEIKETIKNGGIGYARRFIQLFAKHLKIHRFYMADDNIVYLVH